jgi:predicted ArsR family transcriptional regulator
MQAPEITLHRALADERRARLVRELGSAEDGLDVQELAHRVGLHPNTLRWHLGILADAGVVESHAAARAAPGRPRIVYTLAAGAPDRGGDEYRLLAGMLTHAVAELDDGPQRAEQAGRAWGRYLVERPSPLARTGDGEAIQKVVQLLAQQGFAPAASGSEIRMRRCPFHDLAESHPEIVCTVHRGLISGALAELGSDLEVEELDAFVEPDLCVAKLGGR